MPLWLEGFSTGERMRAGVRNVVRRDELDDDTVLAELCAVKGIGEWTAHMFLMFQLGRPDVLAVGDLGVRKGMQLAYGMEELPSPALVREIAAPWAPYRTAGCLVLWRSLDGDAA